MGEREKEPTDPDIKKTPGENFARLKQKVLSIADTLDAVAGDAEGSESMRDAALELRDVAADLEGAYRDRGFGRT